jgi:hypothetical protein
MALTPSPGQQAVAGRGRPGLVAVPEGALLLDARPVWRRGATVKVVVVSLLMLLAIGVFTLLGGSSALVLVLLGMLWLSPWLALTAGSRLSRKASRCCELVRHRLRRRAARRRLRHTPVVAGSLARAAGACIRVRGRVLAGPSFMSASGRENCVLACYAGLLAGQDDLEARAEVHAVPSCRLIAGEVLLEVALDGARYLERPLRLLPRLHEQTIAVGDEVEVLGRLVRAIDPEGGGYRTPGLKLVLGGDDRRPLLIRR